MVKVICDRQMEEMANKRRLEKKRILEKNKDRLVVYHSAKNNTESIVSESSRGESFISEGKKIVHEENMILPPVPQEEPQCVSTLSLLHWIIIVTLLHYI